MKKHGPKKIIKNNSIFSNLIINNLTINLKKSDKKSIKKIIRIEIVRIFA